MTLPYSYRGDVVFYSNVSQVPYFFKLNGQYANLIQQVLDATDPWESDELPIVTKRLSARIHPEAVRVEPGTERIWGVHKGHKAKRPGLSPFVDQFVPPEELGYVTIHLKRMADRRILLTRAYGGQYTPPLPWMTRKPSATRNGISSNEYWQTHAVLSRGHSVIKPGTETNTPPEWFLARRQTV